MDMRQVLPHARNNFRPASVRGLEVSFGQEDEESVHVEKQEQSDMCGKYRSSSMRVDTVWMT